MSAILDDAYRITGCAADIASSAKAAVSEINTARAVVAQMQRRYTKLQAEWQELEKVDGHLFNALSKLDG